LLGGERALEVARRVVAASSAAETEVTIESEVESFVRFADVGPTQCADRERVSLAVRVREREPGGGYREARATTGSLAERDWRAALERAAALARHAPVDDEAQPLGGPVSVAARTPDAATLAHPFEEKARWVREALAACRGAALVPAGLLQTSGVSRALASSTGRSVHDTAARAFASLTAFDASGSGGSGIGERVAGAVGDLDPERVVARAVEKARRSAGPRELPAGEYTVVLEPLAVSSLLLFAAYQGFGAREVEEQSSFLCGRIGERVFAPDLTVLDDAANRVYPGLAFDGEGTPRSRVVLIDAGVPRGPVTDPRYAKKLGLACTGHASPQPSPRGPDVANLFVEPGAASAADLVAGIERGLLVTQLHYTNMIEPRELTLTGMTRNGTFWIEGGEVRHAVRNLRFTDSLVRALGAVSGIGRELEAAGALFHGEVVTPALRVEGFRFTSTTDF